MLIQESPTKLRISDYQDDLGQLRVGLTYVDKRAQYEYLKFKKAEWFRKKYGQEAFADRLNELKANVKKCLLFEDENGLWTFGGLLDFVQRTTRLPFENRVTYPEPRPLAWENKPPFELYDYQKESIEKLLAIRHGSVELATGLGKSFIILGVTKALGLKTLIMAPSVSIADQLYKSFCYHLGRKYVGAYFDGKKEFKKLITIGIPQSLTKIKKDSEAWAELSKIQVFEVDESHTLPATTLADVALGVAVNAPYRFFYSATQIRQDGLEMLLNGLIGPVVKRMGLREGVDGGFLAKPVFRIVKAKSYSTYQSNDANDMTREHLYYNPDVLSKAADIINKSVQLLNHQVLVLIEEVEQFTRLLPLLRHQVAFAHGPLSDNKSKVPQEYWDSDPNDLVKQFNEQKIPVLVGTSCITTGTDILTAKTLVYLQGGKSEIQVKQAIGRGTRIHKPTNKNSCNVIDFDVVDVDILHRHASVRKDIYDELYGPVKEIDL